MTAPLFGVGLAGAGDVNGDGYDDVIVGAWQYDAGQTDEGAAFVFLGSASGVADGTPATAATQLESDQAFAEFGAAVAGAGDVNGDGYDDVIVGSAAYDSEGAAFVFLGSPSGIADGTPATAATQLESDQASNPNLPRFGEAVAGAGDVNADGYDDVIVGARWYDAGQTDEGAAFVFLGSASGIADGTPATAATQLESDQAGASFGISVAGAGDVNGDGYDDVIVGAGRYDAGQSNEGAAFVFLGSASGIADATPATAATQLESDQAEAFLGAPDGWGLGVAGAGDVNADGYDDVIVGAIEYDAGQTDEGAAFVFLGSASGIADGTPATAAAQLESDQADAIFGFVAGAGDVNGDGSDDVIVGAPLYDAGQADEGAAFVFLGSASGIADGTPATAAFQLESDQAGAIFGLVAGAGDVNADGFDDVIVSAPLYDAGQLDEGAAFVYLGGSSAFPGCPPSINCPAPDPNDPESVARLVLFPGTASVVRDNDPSADLDPQCGVLQVSNVPFPDDPFATFSGTLFLNPPTGVAPGELVVTDASIRNDTDSDAGVEGGVLLRSELPLACAEFYLEEDVTSGDLSVAIDGTLERLDGMLESSGNEELEITGVARTLTIATEPGTPPAEVIASWIGPGPTDVPVPISASASKSGQYAAGPGIIGLKMNIHLPEQEVIVLPTSIDAFVPEPGVLSQLGAGAALLGLLTRRRSDRRRRRGATGKRCSRSH